MLSERRDSNLYRLVVGFTISSFGSQMHFVAVIWVGLVVGSAYLVGAVVLARTFAEILAGLLGGVVADRFDRRAVLVAADLVRGLLVAVVVPLLLFGALQPWFLIVLAFVIAAIERFHNAALWATVPSLVDRGRVLAANAHLSTATSLTNVLSPSVAGALIAAFGPASVFAFDAASYLVSAVLVARLPQRLVAPTGSAFQPVRELAEGMRYVSTEATLRLLLVFGTVSTLAWGPTPVLLPVVAEQLGTGAPGYGFLLSASAAGTLAGALTARAVRARISQRTLIGIAYLGMASFSLALAVAPSITLAGIAVFGRQFANMVLIIVVVTIAQLTAPDRLRARALSTLASAPEIVRPLTLAPAALMVSVFGTSPIFAVQALVLGAIGTFAFCSSALARVKREPASGSSVSGSRTD